MNQCQWRMRRRDGFLLQEAAMAMLIVTAVIAGSCQLLQLVANQRRTAEYRAIASLEVANVMEDLLTRSWNELTPDAPQVVLSRICRERLPSAELRVKVTSDEANASARRISVEMDWQAADGRRGQPVRLVAWRYQPGAAQP